MRFEGPWVIQQLLNFGSFTNRPQITCRRFIVMAGSMAGDDVPREEFNLFAAWHYTLMLVTHSETVGNSPYLKTGFAEIQQQTELQACHLQIVQTLGGMGMVQCFDGLQSDNDRLLNQ